MSTSAWLLLVLGGVLVASSLSNGLGVLLILVDGPVKDVIILEGFSDEKVTEDLSQIGVVWLVIEAEGAGVVEIDGELIREPTAENLRWGCHLLLHDSVVLLLLGGSLEPLPWK